MEDEILELLKDKKYARRSMEELALHFNKIETLDYIDFIKMMNKLENEGIIGRDDKNHYYINEDLGCFKGIISINKRFMFMKLI